MKIVKIKNVIKFVLGYIIDICILLTKSLCSIFRNIFYYLPKYIFRFIDDFLRKLTKEYNLKVIIIETFNISIIYALLKAYYLALIKYGQDYNLDFYSVIVTAIVIPIILQILNNVVEKNKN